MATMIIRRVRPILATRHLQGVFAAARAIADELAARAVCWLLLGHDWRRVRRLTDTPAGVRSRRWLRCRRCGRIEWWWT